MDLAQRFRRLIKGATGRAAASERPAVDDATPAPRPAAKRLKLAPGRLRVWATRIGIGLVVLLALYFPLGSILDHRINDDPRFIVAPPDGGSQAVAIAAALIDREVVDTGWVANTPPLAPNALLKFGGNMMNFQTGITTAVGLFCVEMRDQIGRSRGGSEVDPDLRQAASDIQYDPERWIWRWGRLLPEASAEDQYKKARDALVAYNLRLARGDAAFEARADNLLALLDRVALDLGAASAQIEAQIEAGRDVLIDRRADKLLYNVKGRAYGYLVILRGVRTDFADVIEARGIADFYDDMLSALEAAATIQPRITQNGSRNGVSANNHLAIEGFYVLRARTKMREITDILRK